MNDSLINTAESEKSNNKQDINNVYSFTSFSGTTIPNYNSTSTCYVNNKVEFNNKKNIANFYTINLDWFQFVCVSKIKGNSWELHTSERIKIDKQLTNHNPNFRHRFIIFLDNIELCEIFTIPNNRVHKYKEVSLKMNNAQLYSSDWVDRIQYVIEHLNLTYKKITRLDIALDSNDVYKKMGLFRRYLRTHTIQINNKNLNITGTHFNKAELKWDSYTIGSRKYQKSAKIYVKTDELKISKKTYINDFWKLNGLDTNNTIGRFELQLGTRHLRKYKFNSFSDFCDAGVLGGILQEEVSNWLRFYQVRLKDVKNHRKDIAIKHGKEKPFILWNKIPSNTIQLEKVIIEPNPIHNAKRAITHTISEIQKGYNTDYTETFINFVEATTTEYGLHSHSIAKVKAAIKDNPTNDKHLKHLLETLYFKSDVNFYADKSE